MKSILVPYHEEETARAALKLAVVLARCHHSYVEGLMVRGEPALAFVPGMIIPPDYLTAAVEEWRSYADRARAEFVQITRAGGLTLTEADATGDGPSAGWCERQGEEAAVIGEHGRVFDLIVVGRPEGTITRRWREIRDAALFETGRPLLLAPPLGAVLDTIGQTIVIAWNGSTESARTLAFGMEFLRAADRVEVLTVEGHVFAGPGGSEVVACLARHGIAATSRHLTPGGRLAGEVILDEASDIGADLILKGAFTRSRFRQIVFGGTTEHILDYTNIPVFLAH